MQKTLSGLFDEIYVLSMPESEERRDYIAEHFAAFGLTDYRFFNASGPDCPAVSAAYEAGLVSRYPACFRCGGLECGRSDCNNYLLRAQVANFVTQKALWREIAATPQRALVMEDDVVLAPGAPDTFAALRGAIEAGELDFRPAVPRLLRLGWARCADHERAGFGLVDSKRRSNPCHALTSAYAEKLLRRWRRFDTTSDIFIHQRVPEPGEAYTVLPPVAHDLSWSTGETESLIHPKQKYADFLSRTGRAARAKDYERRVRLHPIRKFYRPALVLETPSLAGPGLIGEAAKAGREIGRDVDGRDGLASWRFAVDAAAPWLDPPMLRSRAFVHHDHVVHAVNAPLTAAAAVLDAVRRDPHIRRTACAVIGRSPDIESDGEPDLAVEILAAWTEQIAVFRPALTFRVEDQADLFVRFLRAQRDTPDEVQALPSPRLRPASLQLGSGADFPITPLSAKGRATLADYAARYGYRLEELHA